MTQESLKCTCKEPNLYKLEGIGAPMMPHGACTNCYPRGRPLTDAEKAERDANFKKMEENLESFLEPKCLNCVYARQIRNRELKESGFVGCLMLVNSEYLFPLAKHQVDSPDKLYEAYISNNIDVNGVEGEYPGAIVLGPTLHATSKCKEFQLKQK